MLMTWAFALMAVRIPCTESAQVISPGSATLSARIPGQMPRMPVWLEGAAATAAVAVPCSLTTGWLPTVETLPPRNSGCVAASWESTSASSGLVGVTGGGARPCSTTWSRHGVCEDIGSGGGACCSSLDSRLGSAKTSCPRARRARASGRARERATTQTPSVRRRAPNARGRRLEGRAPTIHVARSARTDALCASPGSCIGGAPGTASARAAAGPVSARTASGRLGGGLLALLGRLGPLARPRLVELDAPLAVVALLQRETRAERPAAAALEAGHRLLGVAALDELAGDRGAEVLARLGLPDDEAAARVLARPAREALAVLDDPVAAHRAGAEVHARDADVLELGVELGDGRAGEAGDVLHEAVARVRALLDERQAPLPLARQPRRGQRVLAEQADDVEALLGGDQRASVTLDVADVDEALDDRRPRGRRADAGVLHRLAQLVVVDELAGGLHQDQQRRVGVAPRRLGLLLQRLDLANVGLLALLEARELLLAALVVVLAAAVGQLAVDAAPAGLDQHLAPGAEDGLGDRRLD